MNKLLKVLTFLTLSMPTLIANAGFPDDLSDVVFIESPQVRDWTVGADLNLTISNPSVILDHRPNENSRVTGRWPSITIFNTVVNANAWGIVKQDGRCDQKFTYLWIRKRDSMNRAALLSLHTVRQDTSSTHSTLAHSGVKKINTKKKIIIYIYIYNQDRY